MDGLLPLLVIGGGFAFTGSVLYGAWLLGRYRGRDEDLHPYVAMLESRLTRLEQALGQTTNSLDRLEAAHRQTVRLITDAPNPALKFPHRAVTPH